MNNKMKTREEIVNKMEEIYKIGKDDPKACLPKIILAGDVLDWVLGEGDYLDADENGEIEWIK